MEPQNISSKPQFSDEKLSGKNGENSHEALNPISSGLEKGREHSKKKVEKAGKISGYCTYRAIAPTLTPVSLQIASCVYYELDPEKNTVVITYNGRIKEYHRFTKKKAHELREIEEKTEHKKEREHWSKHLFKILFLTVIFLALVEVLPPFFLVLVPIFIIYLILGLKFNFKEPEDLEYLKETHCDKCGKDFAFEEVREPEIREVSTPEAYSITVTRYRKCKYCGYWRFIKGSEGIKTCKGDYTLLLGPRTLSISCKRCGSEKAYKEFRKPDIKWLTSTIRATTSYYKCRYCGHVDIKIVEKEEIEYHGG